MRVVVVGGGMAGLTLARCLRRRGIAPEVLERAPGGVRVPGPIMMPYQGYDARIVGIVLRKRALGASEAILSPNRPLEGFGAFDVDTSLFVLRDGRSAHVRIELRRDLLGFLGHPFGALEHHVNIAEGLL